MPRIHKTLSGLVVATLFVVPFLATPLQADDDFDARLQKLFERLEEERVKHHIPGMGLCVVYKDKVVAARGFGFAELGEAGPGSAESGRAADGDTLFAIGSSTKAFAATLVGMLVDEGKLDWDDPVRKHLPFFELHDKDASAKVTIRDLLCHRTGLTRMGVLWAGNNVDSETMLRQVKHAEPLGGFREQFLYNNVTYHAAGEISARVTEKSWGKLVEERLLKPLGMKRSQTTVAEMMADPNAARGYSWLAEDEEWKALPMRELDAIASAGAINSSAREMAEWLRLLLARGKRGDEHTVAQLVSEAALEETWKNQIDIAPGIAYGLGWMLREWEGRRVVEHGGNIDGFSASVAFLPDDELGFALLTNIGVSPLQEGCREIVWETLLGEVKEEAKTPPSGREMTEGELERYVGRYRMPQLGVDASVRVENGRLGIEIPGQMYFLLHWPNDEGRWVFEFSKDIQLEFDDKSPDRAAHVTLHQKVQLPCPRVGEPTEKLPKELPAAGEKWSVEQLEAYVGTYSLMGTQAKVSIKDGRLAITLPGQPTFPFLWPNDEGAWVIEAVPDQQLRFTAEEDGFVKKAEFRRDVVMECARIRPAADLGISLEELIGKAGKGPAPRDFRLEGSLRFVHQGATGTYTALVADPTHFSVQMNFAPFGHTTSALNGSKGWIESDMEPSRDIEKGAELDLLRLSNPLSLVGDWRTHFEATHLIEKSTFAGEPVFVVECVSKEAPVVTRYVSEKTGRVVGEKVPVVVANMDMTIPVTVTYSDFRKVGDFHVPYRAVSFMEALGEMELTMTECAPGAEIPSTAFEKK